MTTTGALAYVCILLFAFEQLKVINFSVDEMAPYKKKNTSYGSFVRHNQIYISSVEKYTTGDL